MSPDGQTIVTGAGDETLRFWNVFPSSARGALSPVCRAAVQLPFGPTFQPFACTTCSISVVNPSSSILLVWLCVSRLEGAGAAKPGIPHGCGNSISASQLIGSNWVIVNSVTTFRACAPHQ
jgi:hypothetical protein